MTGSYEAKCLQLMHAEQYGRLDRLFTGNASRATVLQAIRANAESNKKFHDSRSRGKRPHLALSAVAPVLASVNALQRNSKPSATLNPTKATASPSPGVFIALRSF